MHSGSGEVVEGWLDSKTAAELTGYHVKYVRQLVRRGRIEARKVARDWLVNKADLLRYKSEMDALGGRRHDPRRNPEWIESKRGRK